MADRLAEVLLGNPGSFSEKKKSGKKVGIQTVASQLEMLYVLDFIRKEEEGARWPHRSSKRMARVFSGYDRLSR